MALSKGARFGDYEVLALLGEGASGTVYKARQVTLDRIVALKVLSPELAADKEFVAHFKSSVIAAAKLNHPNLVQVYSAGENEGLPYYSMEYIEGDTIRTRVEREGRFDLQEAMAVCAHVAQALEHAWNKAQLIHRSLSPGNIFLSDLGDVKLGDLDVSRPAQGDATDEKSSDQKVVGSPHYSSPEQAHGEHQIDLRSDIYSLGCTLYFMLAGQPPYDGKQPMSILIKHITASVPDIRKHWPEAPVQVVELLQKMLAKKPEQRHQSYDELIDQLMHIGENHDQLSNVPAAAEKPPELVFGEKSDESKKSGLLLPFLAVLGVAGLLVLITWAPWKEPAGESGATPVPPPIQAVVDDEPMTRTNSTTAGLTAPGPVKPKPAVVDGFAKEIAGLPPEEQVQRVVAKLKQLNPAFDGTERHQIDNDQVVELYLMTSDLSDLSPVRGLAGLQKLICDSTMEKRALTDLSGLRGLGLKEFYCSCSRVSDLTPLKGMPLETLSMVGSEVSDLSPLAGMPLKKLHLYETPVANLAPLRGLPLADLQLGKTKVADISPLQSMPLVRLSLMETSVTDLSVLTNSPLAILDITGTTVSDFSPLAKLPLKELRCQSGLAKDEAVTKTLMSITSLEKINGLPAAEFFRSTPAPPPAVVSRPPMPVLEVDPFEAKVASLPADQQVAAVVAELRRLNPQYDGRELHKIQGGRVVELNLSAVAISDISPVRVLPDLQKLLLSPWVGQVRSPLEDLSPLRGLQLTWLWCHNTQVSNLTPLVGMPLRVLSCDHTNVQNLTPLKEMRLVMFSCAGTGIKDLSPLHGQPLSVLWCNNIRSSDLTPLWGMPLKELRCDFDKDRDGEIVNGIWTLDKINDTPAAAFWSRVGPLTVKSGGAKTADTSYKATGDPAGEATGKRQFGLVLQKLFRSNPRYKGGVSSIKCEGGAVVELILAADGLADLTPLRELASLHKLTLWCTETEGILTDLTPLKGMALTQLDLSSTQVNNLQPLQGMALTELICRYTQVSDLTPLAGMPLTRLDLTGTPVSDLTPLKGMPLTWLRCRGTKVTDLLALEGLPLRDFWFDFNPKRDLDIRYLCRSLQRINGKSVSEFFQGAAAPAADAGAAPAPTASAAPASTTPTATGQGSVALESVMARLKELNPGFSGTPSNVTTNDQGEVTALRLQGRRITDLSPLRSLTSLKDLSVQISGSMSAAAAAQPGRRLADLSSLKGLRLESLSIFNCQVSDLTPLKGMLLHSLILPNTPLADLSPLAGMPLETLDCMGSGVSDLTPLKGMPLKSLRLNGTQISDLSPLQGMALDYFSCGRTKVTSLAPLRGMPLKFLFLPDTAVTDFAVLQGMPLESLNCSRTVFSDLALLRGMPLKRLMLAETKIVDLTPLKGMQLESLDCSGTRVSDLSPLAGMPLQQLSIQNSGVTDLTSLRQFPLRYFNYSFSKPGDTAPLKSISTLEVVNGQPIADFWKSPRLAPYTPPPPRR